MNQKEQWCWLSTLGTTVMVIGMKDRGETGGRTAMKYPNMKKLVALVAMLSFLVAMCGFAEENVYSVQCNSAEGEESSFEELMTGEKDTIVDYGEELSTVVDGTIQAAEDNAALLFNKVAVPNAARFDVLTYMNDKIKSAASALGLSGSGKKYTSKDLELCIKSGYFEPQEDVVFDSPSFPYYQGGSANYAHLKKDSQKKYSAAGLYVGMSLTTAEKTLKNAGWEWYGADSGSGASTDYYRKGGYFISFFYYYNKCILEDITVEKYSNEAAAYVLNVDPSIITIGSNKAAIINPTTTPFDSSATYRFKSNNKKIATVSQTGIVTGKKPGKTTIVVTSSNGASGKVSVVVKTELTEYLGLKPKKVSKALGLTKKGKKYVKSGLSAGFETPREFTDKCIDYFVLSKDSKKYYMVAGCYLGMDAEEAVDVLENNGWSGAFYDEDSDSIDASTDCYSAGLGSYYWNIRLFYNANKSIKKIYVFRGKAMI